MKLNELKINKNYIAAICNRYGIKNYTIDDDGFVSTLGNVNLDKSQFTKFPVKFKEINGDFTCNNNSRLKTLVGAPTKVLRDFSVSKCNNLTSLVGGPKIVLKSYYCYECKNLLSLEGIAEDIGEDLLMMDCPKLEKLSHLKSIGETLFLDRDITSNLLFIFKIKNLKSVTSHPYEKDYLDAILNKHLKGDRDIMDCQEELIEAGYERYARL